MAKRKFYVEMSVVVVVDQECFDAVTDEWRSELYDLKTDTQIVEHLAYNLVQGRTLTQLDGWANLKDDLADYSDLSIDDVRELGKI